MGLIYLDTCICIYAVERNSPFHEIVVSALNAHSRTQLLTSHLVLAECLVKPLRLGDYLTVQKFEDFFRQTNNLELNGTVFRQAAHIRSKSTLKMPDAIHLACAQFHGCDEIWTNDERLDVVSRGLARRVVG